MKTIKRIFLSVITLCLFSLVLTSCFTSSTKSIKIVKIPNSVFEVVDEGDSKAVPDLMIVEVTDDVTTQIKLSIDENGQLVSSNNVFTITINGFDLSKVGSFTASVEYAGVVSYFDYQVVSKDSYFAGGDGSINNPYQITTAEQFTNMNKVTTKNKYFKLMNDISFEGVEPQFKSNSYVVELRGTLDGNNKRLYNITSSIFASLYGATVKNMTIVLNNVAAFRSISGRTEINNVDVYGYIESDNNVAPYASYVGYRLLSSGNFDRFTSSTYLNVIDCDNYTDIIGQGDKVSAFFAFTQSSLKSLSMENCHNYGHIEADKVAFVTANSFDSNKVSLTMNNCSNKGKFIQISPAENNSSIIACTTSPSKLPVFSANELDATKELVELICSPTVGTVDNTKYATVNVVDNEYVLCKNEQTTSNIDVAYVVVSLIVPIKSVDGTATNRPSATSEKLYFNEDGTISLGLLSTAYTLENEVVGGEKLFNTDWLYVDGNKLMLDSSAYDQEKEWVFNTEAPYFVLYVYNSQDELVAGSVKISLTIE